MVWKKVKQSNESISKIAVKVKNKPLFNSARTRIAREVNQQKNCKITTKKKVNKSQRDLYYQILDEERKNNPKK